MKSFIISSISRVPDCGRSGTAGFQPKFVSDNYFIKQQCSFNGQLRDDWKVEIFASKLGDILRIPIIHQEPCEIIYDTHKCKGIYSDNLETRGIKFCSFAYILQRNGYDIREDETFRHLDAAGKINHLSMLYYKFLNVSLSYAEKYLIDTALIDILVCNPDRHLRNLGVWIKDGKVCDLYPIFDNGLGFGQWVQDFKWYNTYEDYMREAYVSPYGEDPFDMLNLLDAKYKVRQKILLPHYKELRLLGRIGFPNEFAKTYYHNILKEIEE